MAGDGKIERQSKISLEKTPNRVPAWVLPTVRIGVVSFDAVLALVSFSGAFYLRHGSFIDTGSNTGFTNAFEPYAGVMLFAVLSRVLMLSYQNCYQFRGAFSYVADLLRVFKAVLVSSLFIIAFTFLFRGVFAYREFSYSRGVFILDFLLALALISCFHLLFRYLQTIFRRNDINLIPTLIVGTNAEAGRTIRELIMRPDLGYRPVGVIENIAVARPVVSDPDAPNPTENREVAGVAILGGTEDLPAVISEMAIQEVIITDPEIPGELLFDAMMKAGRNRRVEFRLAPSLFDFLPQKASVEQLGILPMIRLFREPLSDSERFLKRISDVAVAASALLAFLPVWMIIAVLIKLDSKGPVLFRQERVGMDGRKFLCYKFRTMLTGADEDIHREAYRKNIVGEGEANSGDDGEPVFGKVKDDPRITGVGKYLRRTSLDELPQLLNVLRGEMSVVGPRPPIPYEVEEYGTQHRKRLDMKPGITGLWQVSGRNRLTFEEMVRIDLYYIENWSLWLDLKIALLTVPAMFRGDGAR